MKIDISSTVLEKSVDLAKGFLDKLITPTIEETGLLLKDQVTMWKFKNQVKMLNKAKDICEKNGISPKTVSLKLLCPLLDYSAIEEDEDLQDKWAQLLANMVDSQQNIDNHVFPYLLSQISSNEFLVIESAFNSKMARVEELTSELIHFQEERPKMEEEIQKEITELESIIEQHSQETIEDKKQLATLRHKRWDLKYKSDRLKSKEAIIQTKILKPEYINEDELKPYELSNLIRLGIIKFIQRPYANTTSLEIPNDSDRSYLTIDFDVEIESDNEEFILTNLGEIFIKACSENK